MEKDLKDLLLKDLCARLPYGVFCEGITTDIDIDTDRYYERTVKGVLSNIHHYKSDYAIIGLMSECKLETIKPYLFPLSSMTEEQIEKLQEELCNMYDPYHDYDSYENWGVEVLKKHIHSDNYKFTFTSDVIDWLNKNHFDYRGLIEKSLAIDATNLEVYK